MLEAANPDAPRHPASLAKLMTLYMAFEALRDRRITLDELVPVSAHAASMQPTKLGLVPGTRLTVEEAILGAGHQVRQRRGRRTGRNARRRRRTGSPR